MHSPDDSAGTPRNPPRRRSRNNEPPFRTPPPPEPDKSAPPPKVDLGEPEVVNGYRTYPNAPKTPPPHTIAGRPIPPFPSPRLTRDERVTYHIRFRRGWFGRLVVQVELVVNWYELLRRDKGPVKSSMEWRDATKHELEEIARGYFQPD